MNDKTTPQKLPNVLACLVITPGAQRIFAKDEKAFQASLLRFAKGDLGDPRANIFGDCPTYRHGVYDVKGETLWIIFDGATTTVLRPDEY